MGTRFAGKIALVTGGAKGIGGGISRSLSAEGATVVVADFNDDAGRSMVDDLTKTGGVASFVRADLSKRADADAAVATAVQKYGRVDVLCQNVGIYPYVPFEKMTEADWDRVMNVNLKSAFFVLKACLPVMQRQRYGRIVLTTSITGPRTAIPGLAHYGASKGGLNGLIKGIAVEYSKYTITINGVEPGTVLTEGVVEQFGEGFRDQPTSRIPLGRLGTPDDIAGAVLFLASDDSKYITGHTIIVDGGQTVVE
ncbi:MAG: SDR family oxidoreductase [Nitrososphaerota archaeon]|nr:SDR family oxidoreductase [Nitrososphaerota archaeon]